MEQAYKSLIERIHQSLQGLIGLHRQLLENVRAERKALADADVKAIQEATVTKQGLIESIRHAELERQKAALAVAAAAGIPADALTLSGLVLAVQGFDARLAEQLRTSLNTLNFLLTRIIEQNGENKLLVEKSLEHVERMKKNVLGESAPRSNTYNQQGQRAQGAGGARMISREA